MAQDIIVGLIIAAAALYVAWRYMPHRWRQRLGRVHPGLAQSPGCGGGSDGACSSCGTCGSGGGPAAAMDEKPVAMPVRSAPRGQDRP